MSDDDLIRRGDALAAVKAHDFRWEAADAIGALGIVTWTVIEIVKAYAGWWPAMIFAVCILIVGLLPDREARDD